MERLYFRKSQRIVKDEDFSRVLSHKCFVCRRMLRLYAAPNGLNIPRFGISVSRTVGNAVLRNRYKRLGREIFRLGQHDFLAGFDYILIFAGKCKKMKSGTESLNTSKAKPAFDRIQSELLTMSKILQNKIKKTDSFRENGS